jgi:hypothetical protein
MMEPSSQILVSIPFRMPIKLPSLLLAASLVRRRFSQSERIHVEHPCLSIRACYVDKDRLLSPYSPQT